MFSTCGICGGAVRSEVSADWHPRRRARRAERDMQAHLKTHSFAEVLRFEIRQDLEQVPDEQRPGIIRDIYRTLLGSTGEGGYSLFSADRDGLYTIDDVLGALPVYHLWRVANSCRQNDCRHV